MDALMDSLNESIPLPFGVRRLHTPSGKTTIRSLDELQPEGRYIAASSVRRVRGVDLEAVERRKRLREDAQRRWNFQQQPSAHTIAAGRVSRSAAGQSLSSGSNRDEPQQMELSHSIGRQPQQQPLLGRVRSRQGAELEGDESGIRANPFMPVTSKQVYFVLNGHPHRVYRTLVNPLRRGQLDALLEEVSEGLQAAIFRIYSFEGDRVLNMEQLLQLKDMRAIAVPRHERLQLNGMTQSDILRPPMRQHSNSSSLPPIGKAASSSKSSSGGSQPKTNNIDRLPAYDEPMGAGLGLANETGNRRKRSRSPLANEHLPKAAFLTQNGEAASMRQRTFSSSLPQASGKSGPNAVQSEAANNTTASTSNTTADSDSGRPRSVIELELGGGGGAEEWEEVPIHGEEEGEDDYPEEPPELRALHQIRRGRRKTGKRRREAIAEGEEEEEEEAVEGEEQKLTEEDRELLRQVFREEKPEKNGSRRTQVEIVHSDDKGLPIYGPYSEELEQILYGQAAVKIQSAWRGYAVRKELKRTRFADHPIYIDEDLSSRRHKNANANNGLNLYKPNERHQAIVKRVKTPMPGHGQKGPNSVLKKKSSSTLEPDTGNETVLDSSSDVEEARVTELLQAKKSLGWEMATPEKSPSLSRRTPRNDCMYTITVITGNRWAADTEADLYVVLHGAQADSDKLWLRQEFTNWLQSGANGQRFRQNQSDSFTFRVPSRIGVIKKVTVGHECPGYGAGIFIDRLLVTEEEEGEEEGEGGEDCRQFLFLCNKWFDSGQVDGKLERSIRLSAFYEIGSIPVENRVTKGRWELVLHNGTEKGQGGTSSQLAITGYGTRGQSTSAGLYDSSMAKVPSESLIQVDFGDIGELLKVRVEIDGNGASPDYFLNFVEFKDLDTEERFVVMCGKWLRWRSAKKGEQPFRELFAFHIGVEPLPVICYEGKMRVSASRVQCLHKGEVQVELHGDLGETGLFRVDLASAGLARKEGERRVEEGEEENEETAHGQQADRIEIPFKVEAVSVGRIIGAKVKFEPNGIGQEIVEGLLALQGLFQKQGTWPLSSNSEFLISRILLRESLHTPYRYVLNRSQLVEMGEHGCTKELLTTEMEGISTRRPKRKEGPKGRPNWLLQMSLAAGSSLLPEVELCGENGTARMVPLDRSPSDGMLSFKVDEGVGLGTLRKIRVFADGQKMMASVEPEQNGENGEEQKPFALVEKIRLSDAANGEELRFPSADCHLQRHSVFEMSAIWPDRPPTPIVIYLVRIVTGEANSPSPPLTLRLNISGQFGDVGWRTLSSEELGQQPNGQVALFAPKTRNSFEFEAVSIGDVESAELEVRSEEANFRWECVEMVVTDTNTALFFTFRFSSPFTSDCPLQGCQSLAFTHAL